MNAREALAACERAGVKMQLDSDGELLIDVPPGLTLTDDLLADLTRNKAEILATLKQSGLIVRVSRADRRARIAAEPPMDAADEESAWRDLAERAQRIGAPIPADLDLRRARAYVDRAERGQKSAQERYLRGLFGVR